MIARHHRLVTNNENACRGTMHQRFLTRLNIEDARQVKLSGVAAEGSKQYTAARQNRMTTARSSSKA